MSDVIDPFTDFSESCDVKAGLKLAHELHVVSSASAFSSGNHNFLSVCRWNNCLYVVTSDMFIQPDKVLGTDFDNVPQGCRCSTTRSAAFDDTIA
jgi:hypothetical protein